MLRIGDWCVNPASGTISREGETTRLEERAMRLLLCLAGKAGEVVSIDQLLNEAWAETTVTQDSVYQAVASLRRQLGVDSKQPRYIATVPRLGYRMVAAVSPWTETVAAAAAPAARLTRPRIAAGMGLCLAVVAAFLLYGRIAGSSQKSVAVLPFLDLTEGMKEEEFADGMTEELIGKLSRIPGLRIPAPTSSFYYKNKHIPMAEIAKSLGVAYVLDGSVRKSHGSLRIAARLVRVENGYVIWSGTYDRPVGDILRVQDDIAGEVTKALRSSIGSP